MQQPQLPDGVNAIGIIAVLAFVFWGVAAAASAIALLRSGAASDPSALWRSPQFVRFVAFCAAGVICVAIALVFGGWPTGYE